MTDTWPRTPAPHSPGYNSLRATLTPTYNAGTNTLTITSDLGGFSSAELIVLAAALGNIELEAGSFTVVNDKTVTIATAETVLGLGNLTQVDVYNDGLIYVGSWTGAVLIDDGVGATPGASIDGSYLLTIVDPAAQFVTDAVDLVVLHFDAPYEFYANPGSDFTIVDENTITVQLNPNASPGNFNDHDAFLHGYEVFKDSDGAWPGTQVTFEDLYGNELDCTFGDDASVRHVSSPAANRLQFDGVRFLTGARDLSKISYNGQVWTDQAGPLAGDLSPGATIVSWTDTQIVVEDPAISGMTYGIDDFIAYQGPTGNLDAQLVQSSNSTLVNVTHLHAIPVA